MISQIVDGPDGPSPREQVTLDRSAIAAFGRGDDGGVPEFVVSLIGQFLEEAGGQVDTMREAAQRLDAPAVKAIAHALRGSSMMLGARRLGSVCARIESGAGQQAGFEPPEALLKDLEREFVQVREALGLELQGAGER